METPESAEEKVRAILAAVGQKRPATPPPPKVGHTVLFPAPFSFQNCNICVPVCIFHPLQIFLHLPFGSVVWILSLVLKIVIHVPSRWMMRMRKMRRRERKSQRPRWPVRRFTQSVSFDSRGKDSGSASPEVRGQHPTRVMTRWVYFHKGGKGGGGRGQDQEPIRVNALQ